MRTEYMVYGYVGGEFFREMFGNEMSAREYVKQFRRWHGGDDFCRMAKCEIEDIEV